MQTNPYLFFNGCCEEAIAFYKKALGAEVTVLMRFGEAPPTEGNAMTAPADKVMHASLKIGDREVMASDGMCSGKPPSFEGFALSLNASDVAEAERLFAALSEGGQVRQPLTQTFFAPRFGMVADRFGVVWMVLAAA